MPLLVKTFPGGAAYGSPFVGQMGPVAQIDVNIANLTTAEVDTNGRIKPGIPLTKGGALLGTAAASTHGAAVAAGGNTGNGTIGSITSGTGDFAPTETITILMTDATHFSVSGSKSGLIGTGVAGTGFTSPVINLTLTAGGTAMVAGDSFTIAATQGASDVLYGVTIEAIKLVADNTSGNRTGTFTIGVATGGLVNRNLIENILGRTLTDQEVIGFSGGGSLKLT